MTYLQCCHQLGKSRQFVKKIQGKVREFFKKMEIKEMSGKFIASTCQTQ